MSSPAETLLTELTGRAFTVTLDGPDLIITPPPGDSLFDRDLSRLKQLKPQLVALLQRAKPEPEPNYSLGNALPPLPDGPAARYRALLRHWFELTSGADPVVLAPDEGGGDLVALFWQAERALDYAQAQAIRREAYRSWFEQTGRCPTCGEPGVNHAV